MHTISLTAYNLENECKKNIYLLYNPYSVLNTRQTLKVKLNDNPNQLITLPVGLDVFGEVDTAKAPLTQVLDLLVVALAVYKATEVHHVGGWN